MDAAHEKLEALRVFAEDYLNFLEEQLLCVDQSGELFEDTSGGPVRELAAELARASSRSVLTSPSLAPLAPCAEDRQPSSQRRLSAPSLQAGKRPGLVRESSRSARIPSSALIPAAKPSAADDPPPSPVHSSWSSSTPCSSSSVLSGVSDASTAADLCRDRRRCSPLSSRRQDGLGRLEDLGDLSLRRSQVGSKAESSPKASAIAEPKLEAFAASKYDSYAAPRLEPFGAASRLDSFMASKHDSLTASRLDISTRRISEPLVNAELDQSIKIQDMPTQRVTASRRSLSLRRGEKQDALSTTTPQLSAHPKLVSLGSDTTEAADYLASEQWKQDFREALRPQLRSHRRSG